MNIAIVIQLGGHVFSSVTECATFFNIPREYVRHMIVSDDYPGCTVAFVVDTAGMSVSYLQTLSVMKYADNA